MKLSCNVSRITIVSIDNICYCSGEYTQSFMCCKYFGYTCYHKVSFFWIFECLDIWMEMATQTPKHIQFISTGDQTPRLSHKCIKKYLKGMFSPKSKTHIFLRRMSWQLQGISALQMAASFQNTFERLSSSHSRNHTHVLDIINRHCCKQCHVGTFFSLCISAQKEVYIYSRIGFTN